MPSSSQDEKKAARRAFLKKKFRKYLIILWSLFSGFFILTFIVFFLVAKGYLGYIPTFEELENPKNNLASEIYSADDVLIGKFYAENRTNVEYHQLNKNLVDALIATEDIRFRRHTGIDLKATARAILGVLTGRMRGGGSTITQQLAKQLYHERALTWWQRIPQKLNEYVIAVMLEQRYSKDEILTMYLNKFDFINGAIGIKSASAIYFNATPDSLKLEQAALLVGMVKNPALYNPLRFPDRSLHRRNVVLSQMRKYDYIDQPTFDSVKQLPLDLTQFERQDHVTGLATYFREHLRGELHVWCANHFKPNGEPYNLYRDGLKIYTTIDSRLQAYAEAAMIAHLSMDLQPAFFKHWKGYTNAPFSFESNTKENINKIMTLAMKRSERYKKLKTRGVSEDSIRLVFNTPVEMKVFSWDGDIDTIMSPMDSIRYSKFFLQAGLLSVEPNTGFVKAYVGGIDYKYFKYDHIVQGRRQVGSTFKPFLYTLAMQNGMTPCTKLPNVQPIYLLDDGKTWEPRNTSKEEDIGRHITLKYALATSNNWISVHLVKKFSPQSVVKIARQMGLKGFLDPVPSIVLGSSDVSLYEMVGAMNSFASKGIYIEPIFMTHIVDKHGNILDSFIPNQNEAMSEETAYLMLEVMKGVVNYGTGVRLRLTYEFNNPIAGKTGTTNNHSDGWFMGITPELTTGVWVGCEDRSAHFRSLTLGQGANMALPIWALYMRQAYADSTLNLSMEDFEPPLTMEGIKLDCEKLERQADSLKVDMDVEF